MIGTQLVEELVQSVAVSHLVKGYSRVSLLLLAAPESGKTTIARSANCKHVIPVALLSGRSIMKEAIDNPAAEVLLFNDLSAVRALSQSATALAIVILNHYVQGEKGKVGFAGKEIADIDRPLGIIGCMPFKIFNDHRAKWREMGFVSRMIPFAYEYGDELIAEIKDAIDEGTQIQRAATHALKMPRTSKRVIAIELSPKLTKEVRRLADARASSLGQLGIRLLQSYHCLVRAHALLYKRSAVTRDDMAFLRAVDAYVSITKCTPLNGDVR